MADPQLSQDDPSLTLARAAVGRGWLTSEQLREVQAERSHDLASGLTQARSIENILVAKGYLSGQQLVTLLVRTGATRLREAAGRPLSVQTPVPPVRDDAGRVDIGATMAGVPDLVAAGVTNVYVNIASFARSAAEGSAVVPRVVDAFRAALS